MVSFAIVFVKSIASKRKKNNNFNNLTKKKIISTMFTINVSLSHVAVFVCVCALRLFVILNSSVLCIVSIFGCYNVRFFLFLSLSIFYLPLSLTDNFSTESIFHYEICIKN